MRANAEGPGVVMRPAVWLATLVVGYIGVYLCRKNFSVALPMIQEELGVSRAELGLVASVSTIAYAAGKFIFGPVIDRVGGRVCFLGSLILVAGFALAGGVAPSLGLLTVVYSANRFAGSASWGSMVKLVPGWFSARGLPLAMAWLSLSFVFGGVCAVLLAGQIAAWSGNNWRWVMAGPALVLIVIWIWCWRVLPNGATQAQANANRGVTEGFRLNQLPELLRVRQFWVVCALSFALTLLRETFNVWTVDFFKTSGGAEMSNRMAAFLSTPFDACGALGIVVLGWLFGRLGPRGRMHLLCVMLVLVALLLQSVPWLSQHGLWSVSLAIGAIGFLAYGPYSLLAGILSVEIRGPAYVATVAGVVDGVGYVAGFMTGHTFGLILDWGGYELGFRFLAGLSVISAGLCLFLYSRKRT
ncbi:MAG: MFS transporter [Verrucomicrobia bacterium]|nr:MFS transporter [Verrucomicrobiota bacterium]